MKKFILTSVIIYFSSVIFGQNDKDTIKSYILEPVILDAIRINQDIQRLEPIQGTYIYSGKKTEVIDLTQK